MSDFSIARKNMIQNQLMTSNVVDENILKAFQNIPREIFLPNDKKAKAYLDEDIQISDDRCLIEPRIIGKILTLSNIKKDHLVLDLACSSGYSSAVLSKLCKTVYSIDTKKSLIEDAKLNLKKLKINNVISLNKNPIYGLKKKFDLIFIFGGVQYIPKNIFDSLKNDGGGLITILYQNDLGRIHIIKKTNGRISRTNNISAQTPIIKEFRKVKKEFIF